MVVNIGNQAAEFDMALTQPHILAQQDIVTSVGIGIDANTVTTVALAVAGNIFAGNLGILTRDTTTIANISILAGASVVGFGNDGIALDGVDAVVTNAGEIIGYGDGGIDAIFSSGDVQISNAGYIFGVNKGVGFGVTGANSTSATLVNSGDIVGGNGVTIRIDGTITNTGTISGIDAGSAGILVPFLAAGDVVSINNKGTISGEEAAIRGSAQGELVFNSGVLIGDVVLDNGDDLYRASGDGQVLGNVRGGGGNDDLRGASAADELIGGNGNDKIKGRGGEDTLEGGNGRDIILGGDGDDEISGGNAGDLMLGGAGADVFLFTDTGDIGTTGATRDEIRDFEQGTDIINLAAMVGPDFIFLGTGSFTGGAAPELRLVEAGGNTFVQLDYDGDGSQDGRMLVRGVVDMLETDFIL